MLSLQCKQAALNQNTLFKWSLTEDQRFPLRFALENGFLCRAASSEAAQEEKACRYTPLGKPLRGYNANPAH